MEFLIKTDLKTIPENIEFNFDELKAELIESLSYYNSLVVTEGSIKEAKADKAKLNKLRTAVEDKRKEIKKRCLAPYENFEKQCKEIVALIDGPIKSIDGQITVFDQKLQDEKWEQISAYYQAEVKELISVVPLEKIISPKWKNKTESLETICNGIGDTLERIRTELDALSNCPAEFLDQIRDVYLRKYSLAEARAEYKRLEERKKQLAEMEAEKQRRAAEAEAARIEASKQKPKEVPTPEPEPVKVADTPTPAPVEPTEKPAAKYRVRFEVTGDKTQIVALKEFMTRNNISYEVVK